MANMDVEQMGWQASSKTGAVAAGGGGAVAAGIEILNAGGNAADAAAATILALVQPGDEVVTFEPYYDSYAASIALARGVRRTSVLRFPDWEVDEESLRAAFSDRTRMVLLNTPHNPTGKVFSRAEIDLICRLAIEHRFRSRRWRLRRRARS